MKFGIVTLPGSTGNQNIQYILHSLLGMPTEHLWHKEHDLKGCDFIILPGGFSYGDYLRPGVLARYSPIMDDVILHAAKGGYVLGIGNGFQILTESELLSGKFLLNENKKFISQNVFISPQFQNNSLFSKLEKTKTYQIPVAHSHGKFYADDNTLKGLNDYDQVIFRYCDASGKITEKSNPNGSIQHIAGISNKSKTIFGMMPHIERAVDYELGLTDGKDIFTSILELT